MSTAPDFRLQDQNGQQHTLSGMRGKWVVVYFYPKDDTPGCTIEACNFRDNLHVLLSNNIVVFGISADSVSSHQKFHTKYTLNFPLLSDPAKKTINAYGVLQPKKFMGKSYMGVQRKTFLIHPDGTVHRVYEGMKLEHHAEQILADVLQYERQQH